MVLGEIWVGGESSARHFLTEQMASALRAKTTSSYTGTRVSWDTILRHPIWVFAPRRCWKLSSTIEELLRRQKCCGWVVEVVEVFVGHPSRCCFSRRPLLSVWHTAYRLHKASYSLPTAVWSEVRAELRVPGEQCCPCGLVDSIVAVQCPRSRQLGGLEYNDIQPTSTAAEAGIVQDRRRFHTCRRAIQREIERCVKVRQSDGQWTARGGCENLEDMHSFLRRIFKRSHPQGCGTHADTCSLSEIHWCARSWSHILPP